MGLMLSGWTWDEGPAGRAPGAEAATSGRAAASATMATPRLHIVVQHEHLNPSVQSALLLP